MQQKSVRKRLVLVPLICEIKPFIDMMAKTLISDTINSIETVKKTSAGMKRKKNKKKNRVKKQSHTPSLTPSTVSKAEDVSLMKIDIMKEDIDLKKSQSCDISNKTTTATETPLLKCDTGNDFIEVKRKKPQKMANPSKYQPKFHNNNNKGFNNKEICGFTKEGKNGKESLILTKNSKKTSSIDDRLNINKCSNSNNGSTAGTSSSSKNMLNCQSAKKNTENKHRSLVSELEKELKNPPNIHLSKNPRSTKKDETSSRTVSTKGFETSYEPTTSTTSPSQKTKHSSYLSDEPILDINLINAEDFRYEALDEDEDQLFVDKVNKDMNDFIYDIQEDSPHIMNYRSLIYSRLLFIISHLFSEYQPNLRIYGSCATGLALSTSDMDIGITGFESFSAYENTEILQILLSKLTYLKWVKTYKPVYTATIPVLKLVILY